MSGTYVRDLCQETYVGSMSRTYVGDLCPGPMSGIYQGPISGSCVKGSISGVLLRVLCQRSQSGIYVRNYVNVKYQWQDVRNLFQVPMPGAHVKSPCRGLCTGPIPGSMSSTNVRGHYQGHVGDLWNLCQGPMPKC